MTHLIVALPTVAGLWLIHRIVRDMAPPAVAAWTLAALLLATNLWPTITEGSGDALTSASGFALSSAALFLWWQRPPGAALRAAAAAAAWLLAIALPYVRSGAWPAIALADLGETLFAPPHGLVFWSPILWGGVAGTLSLVARHGWRGGGPAVAAALVLLAATGARDHGPLAAGLFHTVLPVLGIGLGRSLAWLHAAVVRRPALPLAAGAAWLTLWNVLFMEQFRTNRIPRDLPVRLADVTRNNAERFATAVGAPNCWPANWLFAWRHGVSPGKYEAVVGQRRWPNGFVAIDDPRVDPHLLAEGWGPHTLCSGLPCRRVASSARLLLALDDPEQAPTALRMVGPASVLVLVNRSSFLSRTASDVTDLPLQRPNVWRRGVNDVRLTSVPSETTRVLGLLFGAPDER
jgi:hypothetical protein